MSIETVELSTGAAVASTPRSWRIRARAIYLTTHRWIGLILGAIFVLVGLTGALLSFAPQIDAAVHPELLVSHPPAASAPFVSLDEIFTAGVIDLPRDAQPSFLAMPRTPTGVVTIFYRSQTDDGVSATHRVYIDPYTTKVTGDRLVKTGDDEIGQSFFNSVRSLHYTLWQGSDRSWLVGGPALFLLASMILGVVLWWPRPGQWKQAFAIKRGAGAERRVFDLHRVLGAAFAAILCCSLTTGAFFVFRPQGRDLVRLFSQVRETPRGLASQPVAPGTPIGLDAGAKAAARHFPGARLTGVALPSGPKGVYVFSFSNPDDPNQSSGRNKVTIDQYSGRTLHVEARRDFSAGERFLEWLLPLHSGEAFGLSGHAMIFLTGLAPTLLYVTGFLRWRQRRSAARPLSR